MLVGAADDPYKTGEVVRFSAGRLPAAKALILDSGGHVLIGQDDRIRQEIHEFLAPLRRDYQNMAEVFSQIGLFSWRTSIPRSRTTAHADSGRAGSR